MKILHIATGLGRGGAETVLYRLVFGASSVAHEVVSLTGQGLYGPKISSAGIRVTALDFPRNRPSLGGLRELVRVVKAAKPDVVQTWMYHSDLLGGLAARAAGVKAICWGVHNSTLSTESSRSSRLAARLCSRLSHTVPRTIVFCSREASRIHRDLGYCERKFEVVHNGYDVDAFSPRPAGREALRKSWNVSPSTLVIGTLARWAGQKDFPNAFRTLDILNRAGTDFRYVLAGSGMDWNNDELRAQIAEKRLSEKMILLGERDDVPDIMNALDIHLLPSAYGEAFPNVVAEAMSCGTPCVVSDVGVTARMVGDTGWVVPPRSPEKLSEAIGFAAAALASDRDKIAAACRQRIVDEFRIEKMVENYLKVWTEAMRS